MNDSIAGEKEIRIALKDVGMEAEMMEQFIECFRLGQMDKSKRILSSHRSKLLSDVHAKREKLYCMDFICRKLKQGETLDCKDNAE